MIPYGDDNDHATQPKPQSEPIQSQPQRQQQSCNEEEAYRGIIALQNAGVSLLERGLHCQAVTALDSAINLFMLIGRVDDNEHRSQLRNGLREASDALTTKTLKGTDSIPSSQLSNINDEKMITDEDASAATCYTRIRVRVVPHTSLETAAVAASVNNGEIIGSRNSDGAFVFGSSAASKKKPSRRRQSRSYSNFSSEDRMEVEGGDAANVSSGSSTSGSTCTSGVSSKSTNTKTSSYFFYPVFLIEDPDRHSMLMHAMDLELNVAMYNLAIALLCSAEHEAAMAMATASSSSPASSSEEEEGGDVEDHEGMASWYVCWAFNIFGTTHSVLQNRSLTCKDRDHARSLLHLDIVALSSYVPLLVECKWSENSGDAGTGDGDDSGYVVSTDDAERLCLELLHVRAYVELDLSSRVLLFTSGFGFSAAAA